MTREVEKIITRPIVSLKVERIKLDKAQSGINDKSHNNAKDYNEIELSISDTVQTDTNLEIQNHEIAETIKLDKSQSNNNDKIHNNEEDCDEIELSTSDTVQNDTNFEIHNREIHLDKIELTTTEQWERVNDLLLLITTIVIFNATSLIIAFVQITWKAEGTVFNRALVLQSQKTIGMSIL